MSYSLSLDRIKQFISRFTDSPIPDGYRTTVGNLSIPMDMALNRSIPTDDTCYVIKNNIGEFAILDYNYKRGKIVSVDVMHMDTRQIMTVRIDIFRWFFERSTHG